MAGGIGARGGFPAVLGVGARGGLPVDLGESGSDGLVADLGGEDITTHEETDAPGIAFTTGQTNNPNITSTMVYSVRPHSSTRFLLSKGLIRIRYTY